MSKRFLVPVFVVIVLLVALAPTSANANSADRFVWVPCQAYCGTQTTGPAQVIWLAHTSESYAMLDADDHHPGSDRPKSPRATDVPEPSVLLQAGVGLLVSLAVIAFWRKHTANPIVP